MSHAPRVYTLSGQAEGTNFTLDGSVCHFSTARSGTESIDFNTCVYRRSSKTDAVMIAHATDYLSSISFHPADDVRVSSDWHG
jgi:hypothetical protein